MDRHREGFKAKRTRSPAYDRENRYHRNDSGTNEIIRFVRERQLEKQPTVNRLHKRTPLPDIGQLPPMCIQDSRFVEKSVNSEGYDIKDKEVMNIEERIEFLHMSPSPVKNAELRCNRITQFESKSHQSLSLPNSLARIPNMCSNLNGRYIRLNKFINPLPPLKHREIPERPSAPSPSVTPPLPGEDELDSVGEPVDFIDPA